VDVADGRSRDKRGEGGDRDLTKTEQSDPGDLPGKKASRRNAGEKHLDDSRGLFLDHSVEHHRAVGRDGHEQQDRHDECGCFVVRGTSRDLSEFEAVTGTGANKPPSCVSLIPKSPARSWTVLIWIAAVTSALSCSSARRCHSSLPLSTIRTSIFPLRTACSPSVTVS